MHFGWSLSGGSTVFRADRTPFNILMCGECIIIIIIIIIVIIIIIIIIKMNDIEL